MGKRSLILAGGGLKVGYQAGVLQVWLDEAGLTFDHVDGASGGTLNLAMLCQGMTGRQIADNWRTLDPFLPVDVNLSGLWPAAPSLFTYDNFRARVLPFWKIDFQKIRQSAVAATFNVFNFSKKQLEVVPPSAMTEDHLVAAVSLPMWFPPVTIGGDTYFDAVYISDANLEEAVRRGADEIWAIWTVSRRNEWRDGFIAQYFQIIETVADTNFFTYWKRLEHNNAEIAAGRPGEFGRPIALHLIEAEVPVHYLLNFSRDRMAEAVNAGVEDARRWCRERNLPLTSGPPTPPVPATPVTSLQFTEEMKGHIGAGVTATTREEFQSAEAKGKVQQNAFMFHLTVNIADVDHFVTSPQHATTADGYIESPLAGGRVPVKGAVVNLFVDAGDPSRKNMRYRIKFNAANGRPYTMVGVKDVSGKTFADLWPETATLFTTLFEGHVDEGGVGPVAGSGVIYIRPEDFFFMQMFSFRVQGPTLAARTSALARFGAFFFGKVWDVYGRQIGPF
jgi:predicted patatin/cPLA2 family phospholipase